MLDVKMKFPDFSLLDTEGNLVTNDSLKGSKTVIYFYPKDSTPGCTQESCDFRDMISAREGVRVIGVSPDNAKSHRKFIDKFNLNFTLLCDEDHLLAEACGVWIEKSMFGKKYMGMERTTFLLDEQGNITKIWKNISVGGHAKEVFNNI